MNEYGIKSFAGIAEPVSCLLHLIGAVLFAVLSVPMMRRAFRGQSSEMGAGRGVIGAGRGVRVVCVGVFCLSVVMLLAISGAYHLSGYGTEARTLLLGLDYAAIFVLIAGSFTPACGILLRGIWRVAALTTVWTAAIAGIVLKSIYLDQMTAWLGYVIYVGLGSVGIFGLILIWRRCGATFVEPLLYGGIAYLVGAAVQMAYRPELIPGVVGPHELFHLATLIGILCHWKFNWHFAGGEVPSVKEGPAGSLPRQEAL